MGGSTSTTTPTTTTNSNSVTSSAALGQQGSGTSNVGSSQNNLELTGATGNTVTLNAQSPEALAAAGQAIQESLALASSVTGAAQSFASQQAAQANQLATGSTGAAATQVVKYISVVVLLGLGLFLYFKKG